MGERCWKPLAVAIAGMMLAVVSYGVRDVNIGRVVYASGLISAALSLIHWFAAPIRRRA